MNVKLSGTREEIGFFIKAGLGLGKNDSLSFEIIKGSSLHDVSPESVVEAINDDELNDTDLSVLYALEDCEWFLDIVGKMKLKKINQWATKKSLEKLVVKKHVLNPSAGKYVLAKRMVG